jgi:hypothetical protein
MMFPVINNPASCEIHAIIHFFRAKTYVLYNFIVNNM